MSYGENNLFLYEELTRRTTDYEVVFLYKNTCKYPLHTFQEVTSIPFESYKPTELIRSAYHMATSEYVIIDNYFGTLAGLPFRKQTKCIQLWHAAGAVKKFALLAPSTYERSQKALKRFKSVYQSFHHVVVGSDHMADILKEAFELDDGRIVRTGIPRTDLFFNENSISNTLQSLYSNEPRLKKKRVILYAPTFRENELTTQSLSIDIEAFYQAFAADSILLLKLHPAVASSISLDEKYRDFALDYSKYPNINELLLCTDLLITDYSSIPFEYSLLERPMIFFAYDQEQYESDPGFVKPLNEFVPGPIVHTNEELIRTIQENNWNFEQIKEFKKSWNTYSTGHSCENFWDKYLN